MNITPKVLILAFLSLIVNDMAGQTFEPKRDLIETETSREGMIYLGVEFRYLTNLVRDFNPDPTVEASLGSERKTFEQSGFAVGGHLEYFYDRKEEVPFSLLLTLLYQDTGLLGLAADDGTGGENFLGAQSLNTELSVAWFIWGSDISLTAGVGAGFALGLTAPLEDESVLEDLDNDVSLYIPFAIRYNYKVYSIDGFIGVYAAPYITPQLKDSEGQNSYGIALSIRNPFRVKF